MAWLLDGFDTFSSFDIPVTDGRTDGQTDRQTDILPRHSPRYESRGRNADMTCKRMSRSPAMSRFSQHFSLLLSQNEASPRWNS